MEANPTERRAFEALVVRHQDVVCAVAYAVLRDRGRSEEVAQEAFLLAWQRMPAAEVTPAWLCGVARNLARNVARRRTEVPMSDELESRAELDPADDPRSALLRQETAARAAAALAELPETYRDAVVLYYRGDGSMAQVAAGLDISLDTAKQRVHRGRDRLRDLLAPVEATLRATRPGTAFTAAAVGFWVTHSAATAAAAAGAGSGGATHVGGSLSSAAARSWGSGRLAWVAAGAVAIPAVVVALSIGLDEGDAHQRTQPDAEAQARRSAAAQVGRATPSQVTPVSAPPPARPPAGVTSRLPSGAIAAGAPPFPASAPPPGEGTVSLDFKNMPFDAVTGMLTVMLDAPILVAPPIETRLDVRAKDRTPREVLDMVVADLGAEYAEVPAIELLDWGGRSDASELGGDPVTIHLRGAPLGEVLTMLEVPLHMPIGRLENHPDAPPVLVTLEVDEVPAGVALEQVLAQVDLSYEHTTGYVISTSAPE